MGRWGGNHSGGGRWGDGEGTIVEEGGEKVSGKIDLVTHIFTVHHTSGCLCH